MNYWMALTTVSLVFWYRKASMSNIVARSFHSYYVRVLFLRDVRSETSDGILSIAPWQVNHSAKVCEQVIL